MLKLFVGALLVFLSTFPRVVEASTLESISEKKIQQLQTKFSSGTRPSLNQLLAKKEWTCKLYGIRSRLQTYERSKFYSFKKMKKERALRNTGAQIFSTYQLQSTALVAQKGPLQEHIRWTQDGGIISEMSLAGDAKPSALKSGKELLAAGRKQALVVAFTSCK